MKENWTYKKLGEVCEIYQPQTISTEMLVPDGEYHVYGANGIIGRYDKYNHIESEVLLTCRGATCGSINVSAPYSWINGNAMVIHPIDDSVFCSRSFLVYLMKSIDYSLVITGAAQPQITRQKLSPVKIAIPPIETQSRIVSELDLLQSIIDKQKAQLKELDNLAQAVFYDMFGDPVENEKGWEVKKLGTFCSKIGSGATPRGGNESYKTEGISLIRSLNVHNNEFVYNDLAFIDEEQAQALSNVEVQPNDILLNITGASVARCCIVPNHLLPARVNQHVCIIRPINEAEVHFLSRLLTNTQYQSFLIDLARGKAATREALPKNIVEGLPIILPPLSLQQSFAAKIESVEKQKAAINQSIAETQRLFDYTMDKYFG